MKALLFLILLASSLWAQTPERRLVFLHWQGLFGWAESDPAFDFSCYLPRRYNLQGLPVNLIKAVATSNGLPARLLGIYHGDQVRVISPNLLTEPALLPLSLNVSQPWCGIVALRNQKEMAFIPDQWHPCIMPAVSDGLYRVTAWKENDQLHLQDLVPLGPLPVPTQLQGSVQVIISEDFLNHSLQLYRQAHPQLFALTKPGQTGSCQIGDLGLTIIPGHLQVYGTVNGQINGLGKLAEGEWEAPLQLNLQNGLTRIQLSPKGQKLRLTRPIFAEMPQSWTDRLSGLAQEIFSNPLLLPVPGAYVQPLLASGLITATELEQWKIMATGWGDRRNNCLMLTTGPQAGPPAELSMATPAGFALGLEATALNRAITKSLNLPIRIDIPAGKVPSPQVLIFKLYLKQLEIQQLNLSYTNGSFHFEPCVVAVAWELGPFSGLESAAKIVGSATPILENQQLSLRMKIEQFEFLSPKILEQATEDQQRLRAQIIDGLEKLPLPLSLPTQIKTDLHPQAQLQLSKIQACAKVLWLAGHWTQ